MSRVDGAIIELVKNTYDADAGFCCLCFDVEHDQIYILDNGVGMTKETIETCWMLIGTDNKRVEYLSTKKRIKSGEKGIGRFALDRLGSKCRMYTKHDGEDLICWETDWSNFEKSGQVIDDVEADFAYCAGQRFEDIIPEKIKNAVAKFAEEAEDDQFTLSRGTLFIISRLRDKWTTREKEKVIDVLGYLIPPVEQQNYAIITQDSLDAIANKVDNDITDDFDYNNCSAFFTCNEIIRKSYSVVFSNQALTKQQKRLISTYIWVLTKGKAMHRSGKVQLIDASKCFVKRRKNIGSKRVDLDDACIDLILRAYEGFVDETYEKNGLAVESKVFDNSFFGFTKVTVETAQADAKGMPVLKKGKKQPVKGASDTETIPLSENRDAYMEKNVLPYNPLAYIDPAKDKVGYEVPFTRLFYKFTQPTPSAEIFEEIKALEDEETILMKELFGNA